MNDATLYLDHAAGTDLRNAAKEQMQREMTSEIGNPSSIHAAGRKAHYRLAQARDKLAGFLNCQPRVSIAQAIRDGGIRDFQWERMSAVPMPKKWPRSAAGYWPLSTSTLLPVMRSIPGPLRSVFFKRFYLENQLILQHLERTGEFDYYFDGCKIINRLEFLRTQIPDIKVIHMVRHPGAILYHDLKYGLTNVSPRMPLWSRYHQRARRFQTLCGPDNYLAVPYEKMVQDPGYFLHRVQAFLKMKEVHDKNPELIDRSGVHILGNRMRETVDRIIDYSNTWRDHLPQDQLQLAEDTFRNVPWVVNLYRNWEVR